MKRLWNTPRNPAQARVTRLRVGRVLMRVVMACVMVGAVNLPIPSQAAQRTAGQDRRPEEVPCCSTPGGAVIQAWAYGTLSDATQPDSPEACDLRHVCALTISSVGGAGTGTGTTIKTSFETTSQGQPPSNLPFTLTETIDYEHPVKQLSFGGACYPGSGVMSVVFDAYSTLVLDIVGQACQVGSQTNRLVFTGSYIADSACTGTVANADGIGSVNINTPSGLPGTGTNIKASLVGQLLYGN
jgi:hypothetical protein